jgi:hypothetical protein
MFNFQFKFIGNVARWGSPVALLGLFLLAPSSRQPRAQVPQDPYKEVRLSVSVLLAEAQPTLGATLVFEATNNSRQDVVIDEVDTMSSALVIVKPDGEEVSSGTIAEHFTPLPALKPGESKTQKMNVFDAFSGMRIKAPGVYKLYWKVWSDHSRTFYSSNPISIVRDDKTPYRDIDTMEIITPRAR